MASENSRRLQQAVAPALKQHGFKKAGATWRKLGDKAIGVLNLQGSQFGPSFYINLGVYFRALGDRDQPAEVDCHVRTRLTNLVPDPQRLNALLNLGKPVQEDIRGRELETLVIEHGLPWLNTMSTIEGARQYCRSQSPKSPWISKEARDFLETADGA